MTGIPKFSEETVTSLVSSMDNDAKLNIFTDSVGEFWLKISKENPHLWSVIKQCVEFYLEGEEIKTCKKCGRANYNDQAANSFLEGAYMVLSLVERQAEIDEMNANMA